MQMQVLSVIYDTLNTIRKVVKKNISRFQYHEIKTDDVKDLWDLCGTAISILNMVHIKNQLLFDLYECLGRLLSGKIMRGLNF